MWMLLHHQQQPEAVNCNELGCSSEIKWTDEDFKLLGDSNSLDALNDMRICHWCDHVMWCCWWCKKLKIEVLARSDIIRHSFIRFALVQSWLRWRAFWPKIRFKTRLLAICNHVGCTFSLVSSTLNRMKYIVCVLFYSLLIWRKVKPRRARTSSRFRPMRSKHWNETFNRFVSLSLSLSGCVYSGSDCLFVLDIWQVISELVGDKSLDRFRQEYEKLHRALKKSHENGIFF
jgi:hypothetical protein